MLRIAVPNKGMLSEPAWNMLAEAGYRLRTNPRQLVVQDPDNGIELFYLRPLDIAVYVGRGAIDVGITGQDLLKNSDTAALEHIWYLDLPFRRTERIPDHHSGGCSGQARGHHIR